MYICIGDMSTRFEMNRRRDFLKKIGRGVFNGLIIFLCIRERKENILCNTVDLAFAEYKINYQAGGGDIFFKTKIQFGLYMIKHFNL